MITDWSVFEEPSASQNDDDDYDDDSVVIAFRGERQLVEKKTTAKKKRPLGAAQPACDDACESVVKKRPRPRPALPVVPPPTAPVIRNSAEAVRRPGPAVAAAPSASVSVWDQFITKTTAPSDDSSGDEDEFGVYTT